MNISGYFSWEIFPNSSNNRFAASLVRPQIPESLAETSAKMMHGFANDCGARVCSDLALDQWETP